MTIALFSDVHANLPALKALFVHVESYRPEAIYCLGDLVGYHIWPNEVIDEIRRRGISVLAGNHDAKVQTLSEQQLAETSGKNYAYGLIGVSQKQYLASLPAHIRLDFRFNGKPFSVLMVHGSPTSNDEYLLEEKPATEFLEVFQAAAADVLCFGHSHKPYYRILNEGDRSYHAINSGSVGKPKDGNPEGSYILLHIEPGEATAAVRVEIIRFKYDVESAAKAIECSPLPAAFAQSLRTGS